MKKKNSTEETLKAVRRNTAYQTGRTLALVYSILIVVVIGILVYFGTGDLPTNQKLASLFGAIIGGAAIGALSYQYLFAHYDQADALLQVAKFQQRSIQSRNDALALVEKIREEVNEEDEENLSEDQKDETSGDPTPEPAPPPVNPKPLAPTAQAPESKPKPAAIPPSLPKDQPAKEEGDWKPQGD